MPDNNAEARGLWSSRFGFILAAAGSAIGLGNIWRFPYTTGENGGGAFLILYLICIVLLGLPIMVAELTIGRFSRRNPVGAFETIRPGSPWKLIGYMGVITGLCILSYYSVLAGYTVGYIGKSLSGNSSTYEAFTSNPFVSIPLFIAFIVITVLVVHGGVKNGIERWAKILMPTLLVLMIILIIRSVTLEGAGKGLAFYFRPDFSKVTGNTVLAALGQAFFSLSLGMGAMITYGSYLNREDNLVISGCYVVFFDTLIAVMAGLLIFPAIFAMNMSPDAGPGLVFKVLPEIFGLIPGGRLVGAFFFILLSIAALTSTISLLEVVTSYLVDEKHWLRRNVVWVVAAATFVLGLPSVLSQEGMVPWLVDLPGLGTSFLGFMDWLFGNIMLGVGALFIAVFTGWVWKRESSSRELRLGYPGFDRIAPVLFFLLRFFCPVVILIVLIFIFKKGA
ncbi:MAG: sodium-dependent transporter [Candidatus Krumholzibacteriota bacterium]|nr:sodium-dependent transporter [Candidatus Krumholzibacteriota bacterium]